MAPTTSNSSGLKDSVLSRNRVAVLLNNEGINEFRVGNVVKAYGLLTKAASLTVHSKQIHVDSVNDIYRYQWVDCSPAYQSQAFCKGPWNEGLSQFLCLRALKVSVPVRYLDPLEGLCPCGYAWVIWYNLALVCNILACRFGERGHGLLRHAFNLLQRVQRRLDAEVPTKDWSFLQMAVMNNQACICQELTMIDASTDCLERLFDTLNMSPLTKGGRDWEMFLLNIIILNGSVFAPAA